MRGWWQAIYSSYLLYIIDHTREQNMGIMDDIPSTWMKIMIDIDDPYSL